MKVYILTDNVVNKRGLIAEHGLSLFIEHNGLHILFDTGQSSAYCYNAAAMGVDLQQTDCIVLSHGHYDHCGGLIDFPATGNKFPLIFVHPKALCKRYKGNVLKNDYKEIGVPWTVRDHLNIQKNIRYNHKVLSPYPGVHLVAEIPRLTDFETTAEDFYIKESGEITKDNFIDEQVLIIETGRGLCVFLGCGHPGIINCLKHVQKLFPNNTIYALFAGMHMYEASAHRVEMIIQHLSYFNIQKIIPLHCTGILAISEMKRSFKNSCLIMTTGDLLELSTTTD